MKDFKGKVAIITGAASGIGRALAEKCTQEGMPPIEVANITFDAIRDERFYIFTHPTTKLEAYARMEDIFKGSSLRDVLSCK